jgi:hypothetical protein
MGRRGRMEMRMRVRLRHTIVRSITSRTTAYYYDVT